jgi:hypothetical protein
MFKAGDVVEVKGLPWRVKVYKAGPDFCVLGTPYGEAAYYTKDLVLVKKSRDKIDEWFD